MKARARVYGIAYSILIAFFIAVVLGVAAPAVGGHPVMVEGFLWSLLQGTVVGAIIGIILPVPKIVGFYCGKIGADSMLARTFVTCILLTTIFAVVMVFYFTAVNTGFDTFMTENGPITFMNRYLDGFTTVWAYIFVGAFVSDPICSSLAAKISGFNPMAAQQVEAHPASV